MNQLQKPKIKRVYIHLLTANRKIAEWPYYVRLKIIKDKWGHNTFKRKITLYHDAHIDPKTKVLTMIGIGETFYYKTNKYYL